MISPLILMIDTSTDLCSVAISKGSEILLSKVIREPKAHAVALAPLIEASLKQIGISANDLNSIAVTSGPGSYTGLRVGASIAKGMCYALNIPLIAVSSTQIIANLTLAKLIDISIPFRIYSVLDARRMEVYLGRYTSNGEQIGSIEAVIVNEETFSKEDSGFEVWFCGNGALKLKDVVKNRNTHFIEQDCEAVGMHKTALQMFKDSRFVDTAYWEPLYLKDFIPGAPKKLF